MIFSCGVVNKGENLTEQQIKNYVETYTKLKEVAPEILKQVNQNPEDSDIGQEKYSELESSYNELKFILQAFWKLKETEAKTLKETIDKLIL